MTIHSAEFFFFFKQKTAYEMRISDWSSDVCSSDLRAFSRELSDEINTLSRRLGVQLTMEQARSFGVPQQVLERMITRAMLDEMASRLGMVVTEDQMRTRLLENPELQDSAGGFDRNRFARLLQLSNLAEDRQST